MIKNTKTLREEKKSVTFNQINSYYHDILQNFQIFITGLDYRLLV